MSQIKIEDLSFSYSGEEDIFSSVNLTLDSSWKLALIGRNGYGKTTFLKILTGELPYSGKVISSLNFSYFPFSIEEDEVTIDALHSLLGDNVEERVIEREASLITLREDRLSKKIAELSDGEKNKVQLIVLFLRKDGFLLIDEPTNHLDEEAKESIARYLAKKDGFILVSHDRALLDRSVDHLLVIEKNKIYLEDGNYSSWWNNKNMREKGECVRSEKLENEIERLKEAWNKNIKRAEKAEKSKNEVGKSGLRPDKGYIGHKAAKLTQRAKNNERRIISSIESKQSLLKDVYIDDPLSFKVLKGSKDPLLSFNNVDIYRGGLSVAKNISFEIDEGDVVALKGRNGSGKTSLILALIDKKIALKGNVYIAKDIAISYIPQNYSALEGNSTTLAKDLSLDSSLVNSLAIKMGFKRESLNKEISELSPGEARKLLLALSLATPANLFIWDEPFNFIDITTREQIEEAISLYRPTILFVDHDEKFEEKVATRFVVLD